MKIKKDVSLKAYSTMGIDSKASIMYFPENENDIKELLLTLKNYFIIGGGSNTVFAKNIKRPLINTRLLNKIYNENNTIKAQCGVLNSTLTNISEKMNYFQLLALYKLPGTIGGSVYGNASLFKEISIFDMITRVLTYDEKGNKKNITDFSPKYRKGNISNFIYEITLEPMINHIKTLELLERAKKIREKQPKGRSTGSVFKNPKDFSAGYLIEQCGLKGKKIGGMKISEIHANFIINENNGNYDDFIALVDLAKEKVRAKFGIELELEVKIVK